MQNTRTGIQPYNSIYPQCCVYGTGRLIAIYTVFRNTDVDFR